MKSIKIILCILISLQLNSQISLENTYPASSNNVQLNIVKLTKAGYKYSFVDFVNKTIKLYNLNHSIFKSMFVPIPGGYSFYQAPSLISDSLFNTDANVEFAVTYMQANYSVTPATYQLIGNVVSETGNILLTLPQCMYITAVNTGANGWKLIATIDSTNKLQTKEHRVYSLVGAISQAPNPLGNLHSNTPNSQSDMIASPVPNPSNNKTIIPYSIPAGSQSQIIIFDINGRELKRYDIDSNFNTIELDNTELPSGTYFYSLSDTNSIKKMLVVH